MSNRTSESTNAALNAERNFKSSIEEAYDYIENFDLLETITNVGNDEVFTPRRVCEMMLDSLPRDVWSNPDYKWLNPCSKNGVFEREIALRLDEGLQDIIPDMEKRRKHILQDMIYSIALTRFTANVARRTVYYCMEANRKCDGLKDPVDGHFVNGFAIGNGTWFDTAEGNILTPNAEHIIGRNGKCEFCRIAKDSQYLDRNQRENYAYEFIHTKDEDLLMHLQDRFFKGERNMKFDIIIGNPPYQLADGGAGASSMPIYNLFVEKSIYLKPKFISMIIPSRWMTGGKGLDDFRANMLSMRNFRVLHDFANPKQCFPANDIKGGVCYFVWDRDYDGKCKITTHNANGERKSERFLKESGSDIFIRDEVLVLLVKKVKTLDNQPMFDSIVSATKPYGLRAETMYNASKFNLPEFSNSKIADGLEVFGLDKNLKRCWKYIPYDYPLPKKSPCLDKYKVFIAEAYGCGVIGEVPSTPVLSTPVQICTETFLEIGPFETENEAGNCIKYIKTKFFRCLVGIQKQTQHTTQKVYRFVPLQDFTQNSDIDWTGSIKEIDKQLFDKYGLDDKEREFIEQNIQEMV